MFNFSQDHMDRLTGIKTAEMYDLDVQRKETDKKFKDPRATAQEIDEIATIRKNENRLHAIHQKQLAVARKPPQDPEIASQAKKLALHRPKDL